ncbi:MAG: SEC-C metal-binding domain-containing protein [Desulfitobacteriaceae bacterium]
MHNNIDMDCASENCTDECASLINHLEKEKERLEAEKKRLTEEELRLNRKFMELKPKISALAKKENIGRNDPCLCGSRKKFKKCCGA